MLHAGRNTLWSTAAYGGRSGIHIAFGDNSASVLSYGGWYSADVVGNFLATQ